MDRPPNLAAGNATQGHSRDSDHLHWYEFLGRPRSCLPPRLSAVHMGAWLDFGTGALGDMACHTINVACMALELFDPRRLRSSILRESSITRLIRSGRSSVHDSASKRTGPVIMTWYDGGEKLPNDKRRTKNCSSARSTARPARSRRADCCWSARKVRSSPRPTTARLRAVA